MASVQRAFGEHAATADDYLREARWSAVSAAATAARAGGFRFDPHGGGGGPLGLGVDPLGGCWARCWRSGCCACMRGGLVTAALLLTLAAPVVLARWQGLPLLVWLVLRAAYRLAGPRRWEVDPELVGMSQPHRARARADRARSGSDGR